MQAKCNNCGLSWDFTDEDVCPNCRRDDWARSKGLLEYADQLDEICKQLTHISKEMTSPRGFLVSVLRRYRKLDPKLQQRIWEMIEIIDSGKDQDDMAFFTVAGILFTDAIDADLC